MRRDTITNLITGFGILLVVVGVVAYIVTKADSITALIPTFIGIPMLIAGYATTRPKFRVWGLWGAIALAVLMIIGSARGITSFINGISGKGDIGGAAWLQVGLVTLCLIFLVLSLWATFGGKLKA